MRISSVSATALSALIGVGAVLILAGPGGLGPQTPTVATAQTEGPVAATVLHTATGDEVARATLTTDGGAVVVDIAAEGLTPGFHGLHVHSVGACDAPDFTSAGGHFNVPNMTMTMPVGHDGDLPSLLVTQDGTAHLRVATDRFTIDDLTAGAGTALIVHAGPDNFANIPTRYAPAPDAMTLATGDAGARIACGVIQAATDQ